MNKVINYWGGPSSGKSTRAAEHFVALKKAGVNAELVREFAKDLVYQGSIQDTSQYEITMEQCFRQEIIGSQADVIVTDSPVLIGLVYDPSADDATFNRAWSCWNQFDNVSYWLPSGQFAFQDEGRVHTETAATALGYEMRAFMLRHGIQYERLNAHDPIQLDI